MHKTCMPPRLPCRPGPFSVRRGHKEKPAGRPETPEAVVREEQFDRQINELKRENKLLQKKMQLKDLVHKAEIAARADRSKKK